MGKLPFSFLLCHEFLKTYFLSTESFHAMVSTDEDVCSPCEREFDRHCKVQEKRHRDREPPKEKS